MGEVARKINVTPTTTLKLDKKGKDPLVEAEALLEEKRKQAAELDAELKRQEEELLARKKAKEDQERAELLEEMEKKEEEAEFLVSQAQESAKKAREIREKLGEQALDTNQVSEVVAAIRAKMEREAAGKEVSFGSDLKAAIARAAIVDEEEEKATGDDLQPEPKICTRNRVVAWIMRNIAQVQVAVLALCLLATWGGFKLYEAKINAFNESLDETEIISEKINAFNDANIQRVFFEKALEFTDLGLMFIFLMILAPTVLLYVVPFIKAPKNFAQEFNHELTSWQRVQSVLFLLFSLLVYFGLKAVVNTF